MAPRSLIVLLPLLFPACGLPTSPGVPPGQGIEVRLRLCAADQAADAPLLWQLDEVLWRDRPYRWTIPALGERAPLQMALQADIDGGGSQTGQLSLWLGDAEAPPTRSNRWRWGPSLPWQRAHVFTLADGRRIKVELETKIPFRDLSPAVRSSR